MGRFSVRSIGAGGRSAESLGLHREMHLVLKARVRACDQQRGIVGDDSAERLDPGPLAFRKIAEHVVVHQVLVARMTYADSDALVFVADVGRDGPQPVMARVAAPDLDAQLARREV